MKAPYFILAFLSFLLSTTVSANELPVLSNKDSVSILLEFSRKNLVQKPLLAEKLAQRALTHARKEKFVQGEAQAAFVLGRLYAQLNKPEQAIDFYLLAANQFNKSGDEVQEGLSYNGIAGIYIYKLNHHTKAYQYCNLALPLLKSDSANMQSALTNLAALHMQTQKLDEALAIYNRVYAYWKRHGDLSKMATALNNMATVYDGKKDFNSSITYYEKSLEINRLLDDPKNMAHVMIGLAPVYICVKRYEDAQKLLQEALKLSIQHSFHTTRVQSLQNLAWIEEMNNDINKAIKLMLEAKTLADQHQLLIQQEGIFIQLSELYKKSGDLTRALHYQKKLTAFRDSLSQQERVAVSELTIKKEPAIFTTFSSALPPGSYIFWIVGLVFLGVVGFVTLKGRKHENDVESITTSSDGAPVPTTESIESNPGFIASLNSRTMLDQHLEVFHGGGIKLIPLKSIWWFQKEGKNYHAITEQESYRVKHTISELEETLPTTSFFRINRAVIINIDFMNNYSFWENHKYIIRMKDARKTEFIISRSRLRELKEAFQLIDIG